MYSLLLAIIYLAFISLGLPDSLLGSAWPTIYADMNIPISYMGIVTLIISSGTIVSSLLSDRVVSKFGVRRVTAVSIFLTSAALFGFSNLEAFPIDVWMKRAIDRLLPAVPLGNSLRNGRGINRRGS